MNTALKCLAVVLVLGFLGLACKKGAATDEAQSSGASKAKTASTETPKHAAEGATPGSHEDW